MGWQDWRTRIRPRTTATTRPRNTNQGYSAATSAGRSTTSAGAGAAGSGINRTAADIYWGVPGGSSGTTAEYQGFRSAVGSNPDLTIGAPAAPAGPGGSRYGGGYGGGGGGGGSSLTQAMFDQMVAALGAGGPQLQLQQVDLPDFRGQNIAAFDPAMFNNLRTQLASAVSADQAAVNAGTTQADQALRSNYTNAYGNAQVTQAPQAQQVGNALQETAGGGGQQAQVAAQSNQAAGSDQASFQNLLNVLAAADTQAQGSRLNQVQLDRQSAMRNIGAQNTGLGAGIGIAQGRAQQDWTRQDAERRYQNSLMQQQWQRDEMTRNQDLTNQQAQGNWQQRNEMISSRLTPLLELLGSAGQGINTSALQTLLSGWGQ